MRVWQVLGLVVMGTAGAVVGTYETVPTHNTEATRFDTLIVLGSPADPDGKASPEERERVMEAVREYWAGRAGHIIVSGGPVHNEWTEADTMARIAVGAGVPVNDVLLEGQARNTVQNIFYSHQIMEAHGWTSAEVVSSPSHLPRTGLILEHWRFGWRTHASRWPPEYERKRIAPYYVYEALGTTVLRWFGYRASPFLPGSGRWFARPAAEGVNPRVDDKAVGTWGTRIRAEAGALKGEVKGGFELPVLEGGASGWRGSLGVE